MASAHTFNDTVAARTRAAEHILASADLLSLYESHGGLPGDLETIASTGNRAELLSHVRGVVQAESGAATLSILESFGKLQKEYVAVMAVLQAVRLDLKNADAPHDTLAAVDKILADETPVVIRTVEKEGKRIRKAVKSKAQEVVRAEIQKDAAALLELKPVLKAMEKRKVKAARIKALHDEAGALTGKLAKRAAAKGADKDATKQVRDAVKEQKRVWSACYRILALVGHADDRVRNLLVDAAA